jgi:hypothetical protein
MENLARELVDAFENSPSGECTVGPFRVYSEQVQRMVDDANRAGLGWNFANRAVRDILYWAEGRSIADPAELIMADLECIEDLVDQDGERLALWLAESPEMHADLCDEAYAHFDDYDSPSIMQYIQDGQREGFQRAIQAITNYWPGGIDK